MAENRIAETASARRELRDRLRDLIKTVRVFKSHQPPQSAIPAGMVGVLATIEAMTGEMTTDATAGCHGKDLAVRSALDPSTVSRAVAALVRLGMVRRTADPTDGRASYLALTDAGQASLSATTRWYDDLLADALTGWSPQELATFATMLRRFSDDVLSHLDTRPTPPHNPLEAAR
jgi:DNA-binding MarR family transcriptional regulator